MSSENQQKLCSIERQRQLLDLFFVGKPAENANGQRTDHENDIHDHVGVFERGDWCIAQQAENQVRQKDCKDDHRDCQSCDTETLLHRLNSYVNVKLEVDDVASMWFPAEMPEPEQTN